MRFGRFAVAAVVLGLLTVLSLPAWAQEVPLTGETLVVYSGRSEGLIAPILTQFTAETGVAVEVRYGDTAQMAGVILEEGDNSPADVYIGQDAGALGALARENRLAPLSSDILERVPARFRSTEGVWVGLSGRARVLVYNTDMVTPADLPASILDLTDPAWAGRVGWAPTNGSLQANITAMRVLLGEDATRAWLEGMVANGTVLYDGNSAIVQAVIDGEIAVGLTNHYYVYGFLADTPTAPVADYFFPDGDAGGLINVAGTGVVSTSDQPGLAQRLILYLLGNTAQNYFVNETYEYALVAGISPNVNVPLLSEIVAPEIDLSNLNDLETTLNLLRQTGALP